MTDDPPRRVRVTADQGPVRQEPVRRDPARRDPAGQEPVRQESARQEPVRQDPARRPWAGQDPARREPARQDPVRQDPARQAPASRASVHPERAPGTARGAGGLALPGAPADEADAVYSRALRRTQLRLALGTVIGFVAIAVALTVALAGIPELDRVTLWGVPVSWLVHAFAFYPVIFAFAVLYTRAAHRNEQRYRALRERE